MTEDRTQRRLSAILAADVVGYSMMMGADEAGTLAALKIVWTEHFNPAVNEHRGRIVKTMGDGALVEYGSAVDAVECAVAIQLAMSKYNESRPDRTPIEFRIGINVGDIVVDGDDIFGDGVNVAARLEGQAPKNGILISDSVRAQLAGKSQVTFIEAGALTLKNIATPVTVWTWIDSGSSAKIPSIHSKSRRNIIAVIAGLVILVAGLTAWMQFWKSDVERANPTNMTYALSDKPSVDDHSSTSIAITPFENLGDESDDYFGYGLAEDIGTALSKFSTLLVYPGSVTKKFNQAESVCKEAAITLNANYVLEGTVLRSGNVLRATVILLDANDCTQVWSESYDRPVTTSTDIFSVRDDITSHVVGSIGSAGNPVWDSERQKGDHSQGTENLEAYECILQMMSWFVITADGHQKSRECLEHAVELDPNYAEAHARLAYVYITSHKYKYPHIRPKPLERAYFHIQQALQLSPRNQWALYSLANYHYFTDFTGFESFYAAAEAAIEVNPNDIDVIADLGNLITYSGDWERGIALSERARALDPNHANWMYYPTVIDLYRREKYRDALALLLKMNFPDNYPQQTHLAAIYGQLGEIEKAKEVIEHIREIHPLFDSDPLAAFVIRRMPAEFVESIMDGLRKAGYDVLPVKTE